MSLYLTLFSTALARVIPSVGFLLLVWYLRRSYPEEFNVLFIDSIANLILLSVFVRFGIDNYSIKAIANKHLEYDKKSNLVLSGIFYSLIAAAGSAKYNQGLYFYLALGLISLTFVFSAELKANQRPVNGTLLEIGSSFFYLFLILTFASCMGVNVPQDGIVPLYTAVLAMMTLPFFRSVLLNNGPKKNALDSIKNNLSERASFFILSLNAFMVQWGVFLFWSRYFGADEFVIVSFYYKLSLSVLFFSLVINTVYAPRFSKLWGDRNKRDFYSLYAKTKIAGLFFSVLSWGFLVILAENSLRFLGFYNEDLISFFYIFSGYASVSIVFGSSNYCLMMLGMASRLNIVNMGALVFGFAVMWVLMSGGSLLLGVTAFLASLAIKFIALDIMVKRADWSRR